MGRERRDLTNAPGGMSSAGRVGALRASEGQDNGWNNSVTLDDALGRANRGVGEECGAIGSTVVAPVGGDRLAWSGRGAEGQRDDQEEGKTCERDAGTWR